MNYLQHAWQLQDRQLPDPSAVVKHFGFVDEVLPCPRDLGAAEVEALSADVELIGTSIVWFEGSLNSCLALLDAYAAMDLEDGYHGGSGPPSGDVAPAAEAWRLVADIADLWASALAEKLAECEVREAAYRVAKRSDSEEPVDVAAMARAEQVKADKAADALLAVQRRRDFIDLIRSAQRGYLHDEIEDLARRRDD